MNPPPPSTTTTTTTPNIQPPPTNASVTQLLNLASQEFATADDALARRDLAGYAEAIRRARRYVDLAAQAAARNATRPPSTSTSTSTSTPRTTTTVAHV